MDAHEYIDGDAVGHYLTERERERIAAIHTTVVLKYIYAILTGKSPRPNGDGQLDGRSTQC